jgi:hypothetical protein
VRGARAQADSADISTKDLLHSLIQDLAKEPGRSQALTRALFSAFFSNETVRTLIGETLIEGRKELTAIMAAGQRHGEIRMDQKAADLALAFQRGLAGTLLLWAMQSRSSLKSWLEKAFHDFWAGAAATKGSVR